MKTFAQILNNIVMAVIELEEHPDYPIVGEMIVIANKKEIPELGAVYDQETKKFTNIEITITQEAAIYTVNSAANRARVRTISGIGQQDTYRDKLTEALLYIDAGYPKTLTKYPFISAEKKATSRTPKLIANSIVENHSGGVLLKARIEELRLAANFKINKVKKKIDIDPIVDAAILALDALS